jgi:hypothetical protein
MKNLRWVLIAGMTFGLVLFYMEHLNWGGDIQWEGATGYFLFGGSIVAWHVLEQFRGER